MKFLVQTISNEDVFKIQHDFTCELEHAVRYYKWKGVEHVLHHCSIEELEHLDETHKDFVPVGTIEFVMKFIGKFIKPDGSAEIKPLNIPENMFNPKFSGRRIQNFEINGQTREQVFNEISTWTTPLLFIKSNEVLKSPLNGMYNMSDIMDSEKLPDGNYQVSEHVKIVSEYRCFVYQGKLKGVQFYSGDFTTFPDRDKIFDLVRSLNTDENETTGYTFDVYVTPDGNTYLMEMHEFFSCGLYGFCDYDILPYMFYRTFLNIKKRLNK